MSLITLLGVLVLGWLGYSHLHPTPTPTPPNPKAVGFILIAFTLGFAVYKYIEKTDEHWEFTKTLKSREAYCHHVQEYPNSLHRDEAEMACEAMSSEEQNIANQIAALQAENSRLTEQLAKMAAEKAEAKRLAAEHAAVEKAKQETRQAFEPEMVKIKGDCFQMGSPASEPERQSDESQHEACVNDFEIGKYEVTQGQWQAVMDNNPSYFKGESLPVETVSWDDVQQFIVKLNQMSGKTYRLPTEAEWEYAARAGTGTNTPFYTGNCISTTQANYNGTSDYANCGAKTGTYKQTTVAVGSYSANPWGLYDMAGNVWEWTCSDYVKDYDGSELKCSTGNANTRRVLRGGSWGDYPLGLRSAYRGLYTPGYRYGNLGFRLSRM